MGPLSAICSRLCGGLAAIPDRASRWTSSNPAAACLSILNLDPNLDAPQASKPLESGGVPE
jgi:hypothetical protein